ncbi:uncharacterized protein N7498_008857 [Penicillium cinerascens]|uniref:Aminoglycoside phosphotransferase domain-containing protein n=1 Tax=Penicillium cinerascens TaxID=70096 RepID=A0A9W9JEA4_9EURO|nr:uncharacterized protein N7498_008857 [Penicillium cinerascens]KAJ5195419.1 hypothetical protein N7498_008857 [Penicillium cinerascens]
MLSDTWENGCHDKALRKTLFRDLSCMMIALTRTPLQRIGSFILDDTGHLRLSNRPLTLQIPFLENEGIPIDMSRRVTHLRADSYINDILAFHDSRFRHQPNAVSSLQDGLYQACALSVMRSVWPCFFRRDFFNGPFFMHLTDLHQSNILVDEDWNIKCLLDLEWACSHPVEMIHPPHWLSNDPIATIRLDVYEGIHKEFMEVLKEEEYASTRETQPLVQLHTVLQQGWDRGTFWCSLALNTPMALFGIFYDHIQPHFSQSHMDDEAFWSITMPYLTFDAFKFLDKRLEDKKQYDNHLREAFAGHIGPAICSSD